MKKMYKVLLSLAIIILFVGFIFTFSEQSGGESHLLSRTVTKSIAEMLVKNRSSYNNETTISILTSILDRPIRKLAHVCIYMLLGFIITWALWFIFDYDLHFLHLLLAILLVFIVGSCDEINQLYSGGRGSAFSDVLIDTCGGAIGIYCHFIVRDFVVHLIHGFKKIIHK